MDVMTSEPMLSEAPAQRRRLSLPSRRTLTASSVAIAIAIGGAVWITAAPSSESTDDAYVGADATSVAPKVRGLVAEVYVHDNQTMHAGQPLVRIDPEEFDAKVASPKPLSLTRRPALPPQTPR